MMVYTGLGEHIRGNRLSPIAFLGQGGGRRKRGTTVAGVKYFDDCATQKRELVNIFSKVRAMGRKFEGMKNENVNSF
jgi:hypothetical protein